MNTNCLGVEIVCNTVNLSTPFIGAATNVNSDTADFQTNTLDNSHSDGLTPKVVAP